MTEKSADRVEITDELTEFGEEYGDEFGRPDRYTDHEDYPVSVHTINLGITYAC